MEFNLRNILFIIIQCYFVSASIEKDLEYALKTKGSQISNKCRNAYYSKFFNYFDAGSKLVPSGILNGNFYDYGNFDACYNLKYVVDNEEIFGKYCFAQYNLTGPRLSTVFDYTNRINIALCVPNTCSIEDTQILINIVFEIWNIFSHEYDVRLAVNSKTCSSKPDVPELSNGAVATIVFLGFIGGLAVCSTLYEVYLYYAEKKPVNEVLLAFSFWKNGAKILSTTSNPNQLLCLNGIRALSMVWVVVGHSFTLIFSSSVDNMTALIPFMKKDQNMYIEGAPLSVDTFFAVGGLVAVYTFMSSMDKGAKFSIPKYYIHRYLRLTPAVAVMILINAFLVVYLGNGPNWYKADDSFGVNCRKYWWSTLLYIQNFANTDKMCVPHSWYLSVDMQLFILSPLVLLPLYYHPKITLKVVFPLLISGGILSPALVTYFYELTSSQINNDPNDTDNYINYYYFQTHVRFGPYVIGMLFGYIIYEMKKSKINFKRRENHWKANLMWIVVLGGVYGCVFSTFYTDETNVSSVFINSFSRNAWAVVVGFLITLCVFGYGGPVDAFLSWSVFQVIAKISYSIYIVHYSFIILTVLAMREEQHFSQFYLWWIFWANFMVSAIIAFVYCILFESPIITLEKYIFAIGRKTKSEGKV